MARKSDMKKREKKFSLSELIDGETKIEMLGNREIVVDGCKGVVEYGEGIIKLSLGEQVLSVTGVELLIESFDCNIAVIRGQIGEISFVS